MKYATVKIPNKKLFKMYHSLDDREFKTQMLEIFKIQHYRLGRRKRNAVYLDIGANIGAASIYFKDWAEHIYAIEPSKENFECLKLNTKPYQNISCHNYAVYFENGQRKMARTSTSSPAQTFFPDHDPIGYDTVDTITLDTFFQQEKINHVDVMKIDVEGSEYVILPDKSFERVADKIDFIIGEAHFNPGFPEAIPYILKDYGFETKYLTFNQPNVSHNFTYVDTETSKKKEYHIMVNTIFVARRKNGPTA